MSIDDVTVEQGDTATMPYGTGAGASRAAVAGGGAVIKTSTMIAAKLRRIAAHLLEASPDDIVLADGKASIVGVPDLSVDIPTIAATAYMIGPRQFAGGRAHRHRGDGIFRSADLVLFERDARGMRRRRRRDRPRHHREICRRPRLRDHVSIR